MKPGTIFSASDKSLYDALNQRNVQNSDLRSLFLSRGIIVSKNSSRKHLASHFSRLFHDYRDYQILAKLFGSTTQRDKIATVRIATTAKLQDFQTSAIDLKAELEKEGSSVNISSIDGSRLDIEIRYSKVHFNKSEFRQVSIKNATISIFSENGEFVVHAPHTDEANEWIEQLAKNVREKSDAEVKFNEIRLPPGLDLKSKTDFLKQLVRKITGFTLRDVSDVYVTKQKNPTDDSDTGNPEIRIDKASLRGQGVLESEELKLLEEKNSFYVSRIIWTAKSDVSDAEIHEFEAQFSRADDCSDFTYLPRGYYKFLSEGVYNITRTGFSPAEEIKYGKLIESAARSILENLLRSKNDQA